MNEYDDWNANKTRDVWNGVSEEQSFTLQNCWFMEKSEGAVCDRHGVAAALEQAGMGRKLKFSELQPGDFGQIWRRKSGHTVVFLQYILKDKTYTTKYDARNVVGFQYFSVSNFTKGVGILNAYISDNAVFASPDQDTACNNAKKSDPYYDCPIFLDLPVTIAERVHETAFARLLTPKEYTNHKFR